MISRYCASLRPASYLLAALMVCCSSATAGVIQATDTLPPPGGVYALPMVCITPVCLANARVSGFSNTSDIFAGGDELVTANALFSADVFQNIGGVPGLKLGQVSTLGFMSFTYFGRTPANREGTFASVITDFDFAGSFNGKSFEVRQNPAAASTGETTVVFNHNTQLYEISSFFDVFAELSLDKGPFVPGPGRHASLVPEPGSLGLALAGLMLVLARARAR